MEETIRLSVEPALRGEKGDPFTYEDFTPEQLEGLKPKKGIDYWTAEEVEEYITKPQQAEAARKTAEEARVSAEASRVSAETSRVSSENTRVAAETTRNQAEQQRIAAENARTATFAEWEQKESEIEQGEAERIAAEQLRVQAENHREEFIGSFEDKLENTANGVVLSASGMHIAIEGASGNNRLQSLTVYGKTTQDGTPTPDAPVEMVSVENPMITVCRKNLFNGVYINRSDSAYGFLVSGYIAVEPNTVYTFSVGPEFTDFSRIYIFEYSDEYVNTIYTRAEEAERMLSITTQATTKFVKLQIYKHTSVYSEIPTNTMSLFEKGLTATDYEPYKGKTATMSDIVLRSTPDGTADRLFKDADGLWKVERNVNYIDDILTLEYGFNTRTTDGVTFHFKVNDAIDVLNSDTLCRTICNKLGGSYGINIQNMEISVISNSRLYVNLAYSSLGEDYSYDSGVNVLSAAFKSWLEANSPISVQYAKNTPTYETMSDTIQAELNALHTYYPYTTITNNAGTQMDAEYVADTKTYVNSNPYVATESMIDSRENTRASIPLDNLDYAVKAAMCDGKGAEWTDDEKVSARNRLGANYDAEIQRTNRSLDALWKLNNGISYQYETDDTTAYQKTVPSGAKLCGLSKIGGRTLVWNQLWNYEKTQKDAGITYTYENHFYDVVKDTTANNGMYVHHSFKPDNKYYVSCEASSNDSIKLVLSLGNSLFAELTESNKRYRDIITTNTSRSVIYLYSSSGIACTYRVGNIKIVNLTQMFGAGNEPSTVEEFEAMFPEDYYPYNAGELMSFPMNEMVEQGRNLVDYINQKAMCWKIDNVLEYSTKWSVDSDGVISISQNAKGYLYGLAVSPIDYNVEYIISFEVVDGVGLQVNCGADIRTMNDERKVTYKKVTLSSGINSISIVFDGSIRVKTAFFGINVYEVDGATPTIKIKNFSVAKAPISTEYIPYHQNIIQTPQAILDLDGFGVGINDTLYNCVNKESKIYRKRIGAVDLGTLNWVVSGENKFGATPIPAMKKETTYNGIDGRNYGFLCVNYLPDTQINLATMTDKTMLRNNGTIYIKDSAYTDAESFKAAMSGVILLYELAEEEIIDISDLLTDDEPFEVEAGGSLTFRNSNGDGYRVPIPTEEKYIISLAEVSGVTV